MNTHVLLSCWYEGDAYLVDDSFVACGNLDSLVEMATDAPFYLPGEIYPSDYSIMTFYRIIQTKILE